MKYKKSTDRSANQIGANVITHRYYNRHKEDNLLKFTNKALMPMQIVITKFIDENRKHIHCNYENIDINRKYQIIGIEYSGMLTGEILYVMVKDNKQNKQVVWIKDIDFEIIIDAQPTLKKRVIIHSINKFWSRFARKFYSNIEIGTSYELIDETHDTGNGLITSFSIIDDAGELTRCFPRYMDFTIYEAMEEKND